MLSRPMFRFVSKFGDQQSLRRKFLLWPTNSANSGRLEQRIENDTAAGGFLQPALAETKSGPEGRASAGGGSRGEATSASSASCRLGPLRRRRRRRRRCRWGRDYIDLLGRTVVLACEAVEARG